MPRIWKDWKNRSLSLSLRSGLAPGFQSASFPVCRTCHGCIYFSLAPVWVNRISPLPRTASHLCKVRCEPGLWTAVINPCLSCAAGTLSLETWQHQVLCGAWPSHVGSTLSSLLSVSDFEGLGCVCLCLCVWWSGARHAAPGSQDDSGNSSKKETHTPPHNLMT